MLRRSSLVWRHVPHGSKGSATVASGWRCPLPSAVERWRGCVGRGGPREGEGEERTNGISILPRKEVEILHSTVNLKLLLYA